MKVLDSAVPVACWSCAVAHNESTLFCPHCSKIQPPAGVDYFSVLGLEPHLNLDLAVLEREFHRLSRRLHPDRFVRATDSEKGWSLADTALLNDAYRTLKDPLRRTEYLLKLQGVEIRERSAEGDEKERRDPSRVPADLLEEVFDLNMQLEELRAARGTGQNEPAVLESLAHAKERFDGLVSDVDRDLRAQWQAWEAGDEEAQTAAQKAMVALLDRRRYLSNLVRDIKQVLGE
jgi:molecular chaperone HscB